MDVVPVVYLDERARGAACAEALVVAERIGAELEVPVFLYGELSRSRRGAGQDPRRAAPRRRAPGCAARMAGAPRGARCPTSARRGCTRARERRCVAARPPLVAFNLQLAPPASSRTRARSPR